MPLYLEAPIKGRSPNYRIRGTYIRVRVDQTSGTPRKDVALKIMRDIQAKIERGEFTARVVEPDFMSAADSYVDNGGDKTYVASLAKHFTNTPLSKITQAAVDAAAMALYPNHSPATRNRQVYTPVSAILAHAGAPLRLKRPKGAAGKRRLAWLTPEEASRLIASATALKPNFGALLAFLFGTGCRLSEGLNLMGRDLDLPNGVAFIADSKNGEPRTAHLPPNLVAMLANTDLGKDEEPAFRMRLQGSIGYMLDKAAGAAGVTIPDGIAFHIACHSWATWMRRYGKADTKALLATGRWKSAHAAGVYEHTDSRAESKLADLIPLTLPRVNGV